MKKLIIILYILISPILLLSKTIYVDKIGGSNLNSGISKVNVPAGTGPVATIKYALTKIGINDTIYINNGNYDESLVFKQDAYFLINGTVRLKSITLNGLKSLSKLCSGRLFITDSLDLKNGEIFVQPKAELFLGLTCLIVGGGQSSFVNGKLHRLFNAASGEILFPLGLTHSYRPVTVEMFDNIAVIDTLCVGLVDSNMGKLKVSGIRNFNENFHGQIKFSKTLNNRFYLKQYFGDFFKDDQVVDTANLRLVYLNAGKAEFGGKCDSFLAGKGSISYLVRASKTFSKFSMANLREGANALGNTGVFTFFKLQKTLYCLGEEIYLENSTKINGSSPLNNVWYINYPVSSKRNSLTDNNANYLLSDTGNTSIWLIVTDSLFRVDTFITNIRVKPVLAKMQSNSICRNTKSNFTISGLSPSEYDVSWYVNDVFSTMLDTLTFSKLTSSTYKIKALIQSEKESCNYQIDSLVIVSNAPQIQGVGMSDSCNNKYTFINSSVKVNSLDKTTNYQWFVNSVAAGNKSSLRFINESNLPQKIKLIVTNEFGCTSTLDTNVVRNVMKVDSFKLSTDCIANNVVLTNYTKVTQGVSYNNLWYNADSLLTAFGTATNAVSLPRRKFQGSVKVISMSASGCKDSSEISLTPYTVADVTISLDNAKFCSSDTLLIRANKKESIDPNGFFTFNGLMYLSNPIKISDNIAGKKRIVWYTSKYGCNDSVVKEIATTEIPVHELSTKNKASELCLSSIENIQITNYLFTDTANYRYSIFNDKINVPEIYYPNYQFSALGLQRIFSKVEHKASGCFSRDTLEVMVLPNPSLVMSWDSVICEDQVLKVSLFTGVSSGTGSVVWNTQIDGRKYNDSEVEVSGLNPGVYWIKSKVTDSKSCVDSSEVKCVVNKLPDYSFSITGQMPICPGDSLIADISSIEGDVYWPDFGTNPGPVTFKKPGRFVWEIVGFNNCNYSEEFIVIADTSFSLSVSKDTSIFSGEAVLISASGASNYAWSPKKYMRAIRGNSILVKPSNDIMYTVLGTSDLGCELVDSVKITIKNSTAAVKIPNVITANGDGLNDVWDLSAVKDIESCIIRIYNSNNQLVKELEKYQNNYSFADMTSGIYFYSISRKSNILHKGSLEVFK